MQIEFIVPEGTIADVSYLAEEDRYVLIIENEEVDIVGPMFRMIAFIHEGTFGSLAHDLKALDRASTILEQRKFTNCVALLRKIAEELREDYTEP